MSSRCSEKDFLFITSSPRTLFYACKTFMLFSGYGVFISYGGSLCLQWMLYFTLNLDIHYLRDYLHLLCTVMGSAKAMLLMFPRFGIIWGHRVREWVERGGYGGRNDYISWLSFLFLNFSVCLENYPVVCRLQMDWSWSILVFFVWLFDVLPRLMSKPPFWMCASYTP